MRYSNSKFLGWEKLNIVYFWNLKKYFVICFKKKWRKKLKKKNHTCAAQKPACIRAQIHLM
jgi:hypothetical protein